MDAPSLKETFSSIFSFPTPELSSYEAGSCAFLQVSLYFILKLMYLFEDYDTRLFFINYRFVPHTHNPQTKKNPDQTIKPAHQFINKAELFEKPSLRSVIYLHIFSCDVTRDAIFLSEVKILIILTFARCAISSAQRDFSRLLPLHSLYPFCHHVLILHRYVT